MSQRRQGLTGFDSRWTLDIVTTSSTAYETSGIRAPLTSAEALLDSCLALSIPATAKLLSLTPAAVDQHSRRGALESAFVGRRRLITTASIRRVLASGQETSIGDDDDLDFDAWVARARAPRAGLRSGRRP
jgi:hypothetical protein